tara:strand:+ start:415 stop:516 length:102 start_codon:yes stop_codon:yes gene_type:complete
MLEIELSKFVKYSAIWLFLYRAYFQINADVAHV